ncbi:unnamed protein product [Closterium sp. NIES-65]|nr:unnamed protein product [Closterium sp. NIES-65]CAI6010880.1 unnamed protein product [Closterium sp. NIES-65]
MVAEPSDLPKAFTSLALSSSAAPLRTVPNENATGGVAGRGDLGRGSGEETGVPVEVLSSVLQMLPSLDDLATAARVNRAWRISALSPSQLRACAIDDDRPTAPSAHSRVLAHSRAPMPPKPPPPELWLNPAAFSPFLHFRTPQNLRRTGNTIPANAAGDPRESSLSSCASCEPLGGTTPATPEAKLTGRRMDGVEWREGCAHGGGGGAWPSPRTPSPVAAREGELMAFEEEVTRAVNHGRRVLRACPRLQALRVQHVCMGATFNGSPPPFHSLLSPTSPFHIPFSTSPSPSPSHSYGSPQRACSPSPTASSPLRDSPPSAACLSSSPVPPASSPLPGASLPPPSPHSPAVHPSPPPYPCGCLPLSARGLAGIGALCPAIKALTLTLQHVVFACDLPAMMACVGALPCLQMLVIDLHMPFFGQSVKADTLWSTHSCFTHQAVTALALAGPPPLTALSLSPCALTPASFLTLASAFPRLMALDLQGLHSEPMHLAHALPLQALHHLHALALGPVAMPAPGEWELPLRSLQRLRLEVDGLPSHEAFAQLRGICPKLKSLHLLWGREQKRGVTEAYICPLTQETINALYSCD